MGSKFRENERGKFLQVVHPGHSFERNLVILGDGYAMAAGLRREVIKQENVQLVEDVVATRLLKDGDRMAGLVALDMRKGHPVVFEAPSVIVATGGYPELWRWDRYRAWADRRKACTRCTKPVRTSLISK